MTTVDSTKSSSVLATLNSSSSSTNSTTSEDIQNRVQAVAGGILSVRTAAEGSPLASFDELKRIELETAEKERKAQEQAAAELEAQQQAKAAEGNGGADNDERNQMEKDGKMPNRVE